MPYLKKASLIFNDYKIRRDIKLQVKVTLKGLENKKANLKAMLAYTRGYITENECLYYTKKIAGLFRQCIVLDGFFARACTNCWYNKE